VAVMEGHKDWVNDVAFSPDGKFLAAGSHKDSLRVWEIGWSERFASSPTATEAPKQE
jgi:WD40 repeat protein